MGLEARSAWPARERAEGSLSIGPETHPNASTIHAWRRWVGALGAGVNTPIFQQVTPIAWRGPARVSRQPVRPPGFPSGRESGKIAIRSMAELSPATAGLAIGENGPQHIPNSRESDSAKNL